jgi:hypothetical protein
MDEPPERNQSAAAAARPRYRQGAYKAGGARPWTWPLVRRFFDRSANGWDQRVRPDPPEHLAALDAAVARLESPPASALDLGTGRGTERCGSHESFPTRASRAWTSRRR